jgi:hypothetical protein
MAATVTWSGSDSSTCNGASASWTGQVSGTINAAAGDTLQWSNYFTNTYSKDLKTQVSFANNGNGGTIDGSVRAGLSSLTNGVTTALSGYGGLTLTVGVSHWYGNDQFYTNTRGQTYHLTS